MSKCFISMLSANLLLVALSLKGFPQGNEARGIRLMFYNVENLFDISDDSIKDDNDFLPGGVMRWNYARYKRKINSLYKTIVAAGDWDVPGIIALCEIENRKVLEDLLYQTYLSKYKFEIVHEESPDPRGIDVCMIYRKDCSDLLSFRYLKPESLKPEEYHTRAVLYTKFLIRQDTIHLIVNHWPSRRGGALAGEDLRIMIADMVKGLCDSIAIAGSSEVKIIICGDFNSTPDDIELRAIAEPEKSGSYMHNLSKEPAERGEGSYKYKGIWEMIDQVIVSESLLDSPSGVFTEPGNLKIFNPAFLLEKDPVYPGYMPFATYRGYRYHGGFSDHLPVLIDLHFR